MIYLISGADHDCTWELTSPENLRNLYISSAIEKRLMVMEMPDMPAGRDHTYMRKVDFPFPISSATTHSDIHFVFIVGLDALRTNYTAPLYQAKKALHVSANRFV